MASMVKARQGSDTPPPMTPERDVLAEAIEARRGRQHEFSARQIALASAEQTIREARIKRDAAEANIAVAKQAAAGHLVALAGGSAGPAPPSIRAARDALQDAQDMLEAAEEAFAALKAAEPIGYSASSHGQLGVTTAVGAVMSASPELAALVDRAERLQRELAAVSDALLFLQEREVLALRHTAFINDRTRAQIVVERLFVTPALWRDLRAGGAAPWAAALAALETDAAAPLPAA